MSWDETDGAGAGAQTSSGSAATVAASLALLTGMIGLGWFLFVSDASDTNADASAVTASRPQTVAPSDARGASAPATEYAEDGTDPVTEARYQVALAAVEAGGSASKSARTDDSILDRISQGSATPGARPGEDEFRNFTRQMQGGGATEFVVGGIEPDTRTERTDGPRTSSEPAETRSLENPEDGIITDCWNP